MSNINIVNNLVSLRLDDFDGEKYFEASIDGYPDFVEYDKNPDQAKEKVIKKYAKAMHGYTASVSTKAA